MGNEPLPGMGELLEADDETVFKAVHELNLRQEMLARNRLAQDAHWTYVICGYPFSRLEKNDNQQTWRQTFPPGYTSLSHASVPNKSADLCNKYVETLLADPPKPDPLPEADTEEAESAADLARRFLVQDGGEAGTNDDAMLWDLTQRATATASTFSHYWVDPTGGGSIPLQVNANPNATDPANPFEGIDPTTGQPTPTTDYILRYVTEGSDGQPAQFTDNPAEAARQWLPKNRIDRLGREHVRIFPENMDVERAQKVLVLYFCTIAEGKRRWKTVADLNAQELSELCDWTPPRYLALLPPALRARWKLATGQARDVEGGANDERMFFYYCYYGKEEPTYPRGAAIYCSGAFGGFTIGRDTLSIEVEVPAQDEQDKTVKDLRPMDIPVAQLRLIQDTNGLDPMGDALVSRFAGAGEAGAQLAAAYLEAIDITLHPARFFPSTSPVEGTDIENSRATGDPVIVLSAADYPHYEEPPPLPANFLNTVQWLYEQADGIAGLSRAATDQEHTDISGVSRKVAIRQALQSLSRSQQAILAFCKRHWRLKIQQAMKHFSAPQQMAYVGEDGSYQQTWWTGTDFSAVASDVNVQAGTGTMMTPQDKVQYVAAMRQLGFMTDDEAQDAARPTFAGTLGLPDDPHVQRLERQVASWLEGPPEGWLESANAYDQVKQQNDQAAQAFHVEQQRYEQAYQNTILASGGPPSAVLGPESQNAQAMVQYQSAALALRFNPLPPTPPQAPQPQPLPPLWSPFAPLPVDDLPVIAALRVRRLGDVMAQSRFKSQPVRWGQELIQAFQRARQVTALAQQQAHPQPQQHKGTEQSAPPKPSASPSPLAA